MNKISLTLVLLLVIYVFLEGIGFLSEGSPVIPLGQRRRVLTFLVLGIGMASFAGTLVVIDPAVMSRSQWSAFDIASGIWDGSFPPPHGGGLGIVLIDLALAYLLLLCSFAAFVFPIRRNC